MQKIRIDFDNPGLPQHISAVENDSQSRFFQATLYENGKAYTAPEGAAYSIMYRGFGPQNQGWYDTINDGAGKRAACAVSGNVVTCEIARQALQVPGHVSIVLCVTTGKGYMLKSWPIECDCKNDRYDSTAEIESFFYITQVSNADWTQAIQAWESLKDTIDPTLSLSGKAADAAKVGEAVNAESERAKGVESQLKEDLDKQTEPTQGNIIPTNIYHGRYAYVVPEQMKLYLAESDNMTVSEYKLDANKKYAIKSSVEVSVSYFAGCTATKMDTPSGKFGTPLDYTESFEASEKQKVVEFTYTPTEECYIYVNSYNLYPVSENGAVVIGEVKKPIVARHEEELRILKANVETNERKISDLEKKDGYTQKKLLQPDFTFEGRTLYISDNHFYQSKENSNYIILGYKISAGSVYDIYGHSNYGQQAKDTLYVVTKTEMPTPSDRFGTDMEYTEYYNPSKQEAISHVTLTAKIDGYLYIQKNTAYNFTQGVQQTVYVSSVEKLCPLVNKKIVCFGDSIFGNFRDTNLDDVSIPKMVEKRTFASVYNCGFGGCRMAEHPIPYWDAFGMHSIADSIASGDWSVQEQAIKDGISAGAGYPFEAYFAESLNVLKSINFDDIDIIVIAYGTNDFSGNVTETQFKTALSHSIETILAAFPHLKILVVSPMWRWYESETVYIDSDTKTNSNGNTLVEFVDWCKSETNKYHLPYVDTYRNLGINKLNRLTYFAANDGTHPITAGRELRANLISAELARSCS